MEKKSIICPHCHNEIITIKKSYKLLGKNRGISITCDQCGTRCSTEWTWKYNFIFLIGISLVGDLDYPPFSMMSIVALSIYGIFHVYATYFLLQTLLKYGLLTLVVK